MLGFVLFCINLIFFVAAAFNYLINNLFVLQELSILQDIGDLGGECRAHGNLGAVHMSLGNNTLALRCFQEQLDRAQV